MSASPGEAIHFHVSTGSLNPYRLEIFRIGWYGGAGGRRVACLPSCTGQKQGAPQAVPPADASGLLSLAWPTTATLSIPSSWPSGYYVVRPLVFDETGTRRGCDTPFVVTGPPTRPSQTLVMLPVNTWQAYNNWGGQSLYSSNSRGSRAALRVSFNRPYSCDDLPYMQQYEFPLIRWLEREGYDVSYVADIDVDRLPLELLRHRLIVVAGHSEYWSKRMRDAFEAAVAAGTNLALLGANTSYWQIRYEDDNRTIDEYRDAQIDPNPDPALKTVRFRDLQPPRPPCTLLGIDYQGGLMQPKEPPRNLSVSAASLGDPWFADTGFSASDQLVGIVGHEWDGVNKMCPDNARLTTFFTYSGKPADAASTRYKASSGATVFNAGTLRFAWGLDGWASHEPPNAHLQRFMLNAMTDLTTPPALAITAARRDNSVMVSWGRPLDSRTRKIRLYRREVRADGTRGVTETGPTCSVSSMHCLDQPPGHRSYLYSAAALDSWGESRASDLSEVVAVPNRAPVLRICCVRKKGGGLVASAVAIDPDRDHLSFKWSVNGRVQQEHGRTLVVRLGRRIPHQLTCTAIDAFGASATATWLIGNRTAP
ncbi:MAG: hypothetical protein JWM53_4637 [bacterium]|nr:hypothetical protein [bacterium]